MSSDVYAATRKVKPGRIKGQLRDVYRGTIQECSHTHKTVSAALRCAEKLQKGTAA